MRFAFTQGDIDHVFMGGMGGAFGLNRRLELVAEIFLSSERTTVHMKDPLSGPEGFLPFVRAVLAGLKDYEPQDYVEPDEPQE